MDQLFAVNEAYLQPSIARASAGVVTASNLQMASQLMKPKISPQLNMVWQMTGLCLAWGIGVGVLLDLVINPVSNRFFPPVLPIAIMSATFGLGYGLVALALSVSLSKRNFRGFRYFLPIAITGIAVTCFPFADNSLFYTILEQKPISPLNLTLLALHALSVIAFSQIVALRFIRDMTARKRKQEP